MQSPRPWWSSPQRVLQPILRSCDGAADMRAIAAMAAEDGYTAILQNVGGMYAWYPSKIPFHVNPDGMQGDPLGELIEAAHARGIRVMARFDLSGLRHDAYAAKPEWFYQSKSGAPMIDKGLYATCLSTSFLEEFFFPMFEELLGRYEIDGVFFNMFGYRDTDRRGVYHGPCHCPACRARFKAECGAELPDGPQDPQWQRYLEYRERMFERAAQRVYDRIKAKNKDIAFLDGRGRKAMDSLLRGLGDVAEMELHWMPPNPRALDNVPHYNWPYSPGESCRHVRTLAQGQSAMVNVFQCGAGRLIGHSTGWNTTAVAQAIANGGWPFIAFTGEPWAQGTRSRAELNALLARMKREDARLTGLASVPAVALLTSGQNLDANRVHADTAGLLHDFRGWYQMLVQKHIEFDIVDTLQIGRPDGGALLSRYGLVIIPPIAMLTDAQCAALDAYVRAGGHAIVCGEAGFYREDASERATPGLDCAGIEMITARREMVKNAFFRTDDSPLPSLSAVRLLALNGPVVFAKAATGAEAFLPMEEEIEYASPEQEVFESSPGHPGLLLYACGNGKTAYLPWLPARLWHLYGQDDHGLLLSDLIDAMLPAPPPVETDAPACVEITLQRQAETGRYILQMVNHSGRDGVAFHAPIAFGNLNVRVNIPGLCKARCETHGDLPVQADGKGCAFTLPSLMLYELIELTP